MSEVGSDEFAGIENKLVMLAVDSSPESRGAVMWAVRSLINPGDEVLIFYAIKTLKEIPTAMGMVPFAGANREMQQAHMLVTEENAKKMVATHSAYCQTQKIEPNTEVIWGQRRQAILDRVVQVGVTHLVMGTGKSSRRLSFLRKESLTATVSREAQCQVFLVAKNGKLASRSSYNADASGRPKLLQSAASAPDRLMNADAETSSNSSFGTSPHPPSSVRDSGTLSSASSTHYPPSEIDETESPLGSPYPPLFRAMSTPPRSPDSPVTVLAKKFGARSGGLQRTISNPSPLAKGGEVSDRRSSVPAPPRTGTTPSTYDLDWAPKARRAASVALPSTPLAPRPSSRGARDDASMPEDDVSLAGSDVGKDDAAAAELAALRAQVRQLQLVSEMRAREAARFAERLEAKEGEAEAVARQLAEESRRRKAAERTASRLVSALGETAPEKVVDIMTGGIDAGN